MLNLEAHTLISAIAEKTLDKNHFKTAQKTMDRTQPSFKIGDRVYFKNKQPSKWDLKWRPGYRIVQTEHDRHFLHIQNRATGKVQSCNVRDIVLEPPVRILEYRHPIWQSWKIYEPPCKSTYHKPT